MSGNSVQKLLDDVKHARLVLPDFQRDFVWYPDGVAELLVSVFEEYYVGSMLYMDSIRDEAPFQLKLIEGVESAFPKIDMQSIVKILLDGQQRTSSLFYAIYAPDIPLRGRKNPFLFFIDLDFLIKGDFEKSVVYANKSSKKEMSRLTTSERFLPFTALQDIGNLSSKILMGEYKNHIGLIINAVNKFLNYEVHMVRLERDTPLERVVETFERINRTGEPLSITDLLVARLYKPSSNSPGIRLRELLASASNNFKFLNHVPSDFILRCMCLIRGRDISRHDILNLDPANFEKDWDISCKFLQKAFDRISDTKQGYGAFDFKRLVPFSTLIVPLAVLIHHAERQLGSQPNAFSKIDQWWWSAVFQNRYNEAVNSQTVNDIRRMQEWFNEDSKIPNFVQSLNVNSIDFGVEAKSSSTYRGVLCLIARTGALDFASGYPPQFVSDVEDDHIFPKSVYAKNEIFNRTLISSNREKGNKVPSLYFRAWETVHGRKKLEEIMESHLINSNALSALLDDDAKAFRAEREAVFRSKIAALVPSAVGIEE